MKTARLLIALSLTVLLYGCTPQENETTTKRLNELSEQIIGLKADLDGATKTIEALKLSADAREFRDSLRSLAYLRPGDEGYSTVASDLGVLTIQMTDIKPYANGSKVTVRFGNPLSASINGLKATVDWGHVDGNGFPLNDSAKSKELKLAQTITAGAWSTTSVVLDDVPPTELGFVRIRGITHTGIKLLSK